LGTIVADLIVDLGNTRAKFAVFDGGEVVWREALCWDELGRLKNALAAAPAVEACALVSVAPSRNSEVSALIESCGLPRPGIVGEDLPILIENAASEPGSVGHDRLMNATWAAKRTDGAAITVSFGTAVTFELIDGSGAFQGGAIAPGLRTLARSLATDAEQLPEISWDGEKPPCLGRDSAKAIRSGVVWGLAGAVEGILAGLRSEFGTPLPAFATGGDAVKMAPLCPGIHRVVDEMTLLGAWLTLDGNR
jgi:type III pantothenate kinase